MDKKTILIIDDDVNYTKLVKVYLEKTGKYEVAIENDGGKYLSAANQAKPNLILLDLMMPNIDGGEVAQGIKSDKNLKNTPIIFVTSMVKKTDAVTKTGDKSGHTYLSKSVSTTDLIKKIEEMIG